MSKKLFTNEEIEILSKNIYVKNVTNKGITYTDEFKHLFIVENESGKLPRQIFENAGFDVNILGMKRVKLQLIDGELHINIAELSLFKILENLIQEGLQLRAYLLKKNMHV